MSQLARVDAADAPVQLFNLPYCHFTPTSLTLDEDTSFDNCENIAGLLARIDHSLRWWIGDLLAFTERRYGETFAQLGVKFGLSESTLGNAMFVSSKICPSRRREALTWSHHAEVAGLPESEQERMLDLAVENRWTRLTLRHRIQAKKLEAEYSALDEPLRQDYAKIKAGFLAARREMDEFVAEFSQFEEYWEGVVGDIMWDLANPAESSLDWVFRKIESGCSKLREIVSETKLSEEVVRLALSKLVSDNKIYVDQQGPATPNQRGAREELYFVIPERREDLYEVRTSSMPEPDYD